MEPRRAAARDTRRSGQRSKPRDFEPSFLVNADLRPAEFLRITPERKDGKEI
jgi:hypothetical protein